jgi:16S rRNA (guanine(527)-N(7))-methyltransferase RsmG
LKLTPAEQVHMEHLERWRKAMDLVGPGPLEPHFQDAARAVAWLDASGPWADLGSGAGFPGIALAARNPKATVALVESRRKRAIFLKELASSCGLDNVEVLHQRVEALAPESLAGVVARAFQPPAAMLKTVRPLLELGGIAVVLVAREDPQDAEGFEMFHVEHYKVEGKPRRSVGYRRTG